MKPQKQRQSTKVFQDHWWQHQRCGNAVARSFSWKEKNSLQNCCLQPSSQNEEQPTWSQRNLPRWSFVCTCIPDLKKLSRPFAQTPRMSLLSTQIARGPAQVSQLRKQVVRNFTLDLDHFLKCGKLATDPTNFCSIALVATSTAKAKNQTHQSKFLDRTASHKSGVCSEEGATSSDCFGMIACCP